MASVQAFVFVRDLLITGRISLRDCAVYPLQDYAGVEADIEMINQVVRTLLKRDIEELRLSERQYRQNRKHHCVFHFPSINPQMLREAYADVLQVLSLTRGSRGAVYATVTFDPDGRNPPIRVPRQVYPGNLMGGILSGEDPDLLNGMLTKLQQTPLLRVYVDLFNHAKAEREPGLRFFRCWQVLEGLAEMRVHSGDNFLEKSTPGKKGDSKIRVYHLLKEWRRKRHVVERSPSDAPEHISLWQYVVWWHAMRSCIAHHGRFALGDSVLKARFRDYSICEEIFWKQGGKVDWMVAY